MTKRPKLEPQPIQALEPRTPKQASYYKQLKSHDLVFGIGPAGTGKTFTAAHHGASLLESDPDFRYIIIRPTVAVEDEDLGAIPGDLEEKFAPWARPVVDELTKIAGKEKVRRWKAEGRIEAVPIPYTHVLHIIGQASDQFNQLPDLTADVKGRIVKVPNNYDPVTRTYTGIWDGATYKLAWTDNGAYCTQDFIESDRYGLSTMYPLTVNKQSFYEWGKWCDEPVPNGKGGTRPRWTYNDVIEEQRSAKEQVEYMAGSCGARIIDDGNGNFDVLVDRDDVMSFVFAPDNVVDGQFTYSFTDAQTRANWVKVGFVNPELNWAVDYRVVKDDKSRGRRTVIIPIYDQLRQLLDKRPASDAVTILTSSRGTPWTEDGLKTAMQRAKADALEAAQKRGDETSGIEHLRFHDLRGTAVTNLIRAGLTLQDVALIVGWSKEKVQDIATRYVTGEEIALAIVERLNQNKR